MAEPAATLRRQQMRFNLFQREYNEQRPHEALGQVVPASLYRPAAVSYPRRIAGPEYPRAWSVRKVNDRGQVNWAGQGSRRWFLSHALDSKQVGFEPMEDGVWRVWFYQQWLGVWNERQRHLWRPGQRQAEWARPLSPVASQ